MRMLSQSSDRNAIELGLSRLRRLAPSGYALGIHIRFASPLIMVQTYDPAWIGIYTSRGYMMCDPLISWGFAMTGRARWSELDHPDPHDVLGQAAEFGLVYGVAVSVGPTTSRTIGGFARADREFSDAEIAKIEETVIRLHDAATPPESLTMAQIMALRQVAAGFRHAEAAALLGISESAFKARLRSARDRLMARTTAEAVQRAQEYKLL